MSKSSQVVSFLKPGFESLDLAALQQIPGVPGAADTTLRWANGGRGDPQLTVVVSQDLMVSIMRDVAVAGRFEVAVLTSRPGGKDALHEHCSPEEVVSLVRAAAALGRVGSKT